MRSDSTTPGIVSRDVMQRSCVPGEEKAMTANVSEIVIAATPEQVWPWLVEPDRVKQWQYGSQLITDWVPGSPIRFRNEWEGQVFEQWGTVLAVARPHLIRYTLFFPRPGLEDIPENAFVMTYRLIPDEMNGVIGTRLQIEQEDQRPADPTADASTDDTDDGSNVLTTLKALVEEAAIA
jgi:uncharacterized protein YndB with AHSA1/START domain